MEQYSDFGIQDLIDSLTGSGVLEIKDIEFEGALDGATRAKQIEHAVSLFPNRLEVQPAHDGVLHIACYGPTLKTAIPDLWGKTVMTVSGAHDFLIERGIVPEWHVDSDPRAHKARFVANPHQGVKYLMASHCHPDTFANLQGHDVTLWHAADPKPETGHMLDRLEPGALEIYGGSSAGHRAITVGYALGYRAFHVYGMDFSTFNWQHHAGPHYEGWDHKKFMTVRCGTRDFQSKAEWVVYARQCLQEVQNLKDCAFFFHGDGLLQHMMKLATERTENV